MARQSPSDKLARLITVTRAWERICPGRAFHGHTLAQFRKVIEPSHETRAEIADLQKRLRIAITRRDVADERSMRIVRGVVFGVMGDPEHGENEELYAAMGYVRKSARRKRHRAKK